MGNELEKPYLQMPMPDGMSDGFWYRLEDCYPVNERWLLICVNDNELFIARYSHASLPDKPIFQVKSMPVNTYRQVFEVKGWCYISDPSLYLTLK